VDYVTGVVHLYQPLRDDETLAVAYEEVSTESRAAGAFAAPSSADFDLSRPGTYPSGLLFSVNDTIASYLRLNLQTQVAKGRPLGNYFGNDSERFTEFNAQTNTPIDTRLSAATAQFLASSSYGPLQLTLLPWTQAARRSVFDRVLKVEDVPLYTLASGRKADWETGVTLGALFHETTLARVNATCTPCDTERWSLMWSGVFAEYNPPDSKYSIGPRFSQDRKNKVIRDADRYQPR
jgi:hypothetical protein